MKKIIGCICIILLSLFAIKPLFSSGYFPMHDDTQVARVIVMGKALQQGQFPVRWVSDLGYGYGYPIFNFYGPVPYYIGGGLYALGIDSVWATKIMFAIGMVVAPITLFILVESSLGFLAALTASTLFLFAPYHAVEVYIRGSVGEYWAIAFVPLLLYGLKLSLQKRSKTKGIIIGSVSLALVIASHTILGFITCAFLGIGLFVYEMVLLLRRKFQRYLLIYPALLCLLGLGIAAFFWLPAIVEMGSTSVSQMLAGAGTTFFDHFVCVGQLWNSQWGFAGSAPGCIDGMSFKLGKVQILIALVSFVTWLFLLKNHRQKGKNVYMTLSALGLAISIFLMLQVSSVFWNYIPLTSVLQYPWRFLTFAMMFIAMAGAYIVSVPRQPIIRIGIMFMIVFMTIFVNEKIFVPQYLYMRDSSAFGTVEELRFTKSKISDEYLPQGIIKPTNVSEVVNASFQGKSVFQVHSLRNSDTSLYAELESDTAQAIVIKKAWFPGWMITINGKRVEPTLIAGMPSVNIMAGISIIRMQFTNTPVRMLGNVLSICSVIIIGFLLAYGKKTNA